MKIIYLTDIHDALKELRSLLATTTADLYLLSGDLIYKAFYEEGRIYNFVCLQEEFYQIIRQNKLKILPTNLALEILRFPERYANDYYPKNVLLQKAKNYTELFELAAKTMREKYTLMLELIQKYAQAPTWVLPGNYDIDLRYTDLHDQNLHCEVKYKQALKFAGYGGAPVNTSGIPDSLSVVYHESIINGNIYSEGYDFFNLHKPDILVLHQPVYGFFDCLPSLGHIGSQGLRNYIEKNEPSLVLSGHVHEDYGIARYKNTIFVNPSNFGGVDSVQGWQAGGTYAEIFMNEKRVEEVVFKLHLIENEAHIQLLNVSNTEKELSINSKLNESQLRSIHCPLKLEEMLRDTQCKVLV